MVGLALALATLLVIVCTLWFFVVKPWLGLPYQPALPNEVHLRKVFDAKREVFEQIRTMASADGLNPFQVRASDASSFGLPAERIHEYRRRLALIDRGLTLIVNADLDLEFEFEGGATALVIGPEWSNGIAYIASDVERKGELLNSMKEMTLKDGNTSLVLLGGHWYIYHQEL